MAEREGKKYVKCLGSSLNRAKDWEWLNFLSVAPGIAYSELLLTDQIANLRIKRLKLVQHIISIFKLGFAINYVAPMGAAHRMGRVAMLLTRKKNWTNRLSKSRLELAGITQKQLGTLLEEGQEYALQNQENYCKVLVQTASTIITRTVPPCFRGTVLKDINSTRENEYLKWKERQKAIKLEFKEHQVKKFYSQLTPWVQRP